MKPQEQLMTGAAVLVSLFSIIAMAVMLHFASVKTVVIAEDVTPGTSMTAERAQEETKGKPLRLESQGTSKGALKIPLPDGVRPDDIVIENRYTEHVINVFMAGAESGFYEKAFITGNRSAVKQASYTEEKESVCLQLQMNGFYEHKYLFQDNTLYLEFVYPKELYDKVVVIDAAHGGSDSGNQVKGSTEKEIVLDIAMRLKIKLENSGIRAYYTRTEDTAVTEEERINLINQSDADICISIHVNADEKNAQTCGTQVRYNPEFVIPYFGNIELADMLEREIVKQLDGKANGLLAAEEESMLYALEIPAAQLEIGYLTNGQEAELLSHEEYREEAAQGIYNTIIGYYMEQAAVGR